MLECTFLGPEILFEQDVEFAVTGAPFQPRLDGEAISMYQTCRAFSGQKLSLGIAQGGCRAYLAIAGGIDVPPVLGSRSTYLKAKLGGLEGRKLAVNDELPIGVHRKSPKSRLLRIAPEYQPLPVDCLRVTLDAQYDLFADRGIETFLTETFTVAKNCDRMGCRLDCPIIETKSGNDIISDGIAFGAIQIPAEGKPIIMLADRQTCGGYAKIAHVISADFRRLGQLKSGDRVRFRRVSLDEAQEARRCEMATLELLKRSQSG